MITQMKTIWDQLMEDEDQITKTIGEDEMDRLKDNRRRYFLLLLETRNVVKIMLEQSECMKESIEFLQDMATESINAGKDTRSEERKKLFQKEMDIMKEWIDETELTRIIEKWSLLCTDLDVECLFPFDGKVSI